MSIGQEIRIKELEREQETARNQRAQEHFVKEFLNNIGTLLAGTPKKNWPRMAQIAFADAARKAPTGAQAYVNNLPKD